ncbi:outer membrane beta-barrel protein [Vibrio breoganii]|uniref:outer membrane beta-barrel protein n=2 Tax=Vibrio TaxID=662 RepID=UPI000C846F1C|nr:outer membrane beta-barrel protein [Vibrio breoganii]PML10940.1 hypothetical protein BCT84_03500 [Vibrio breoganii]
MKKLVALALCVAGSVGSVSAAEPVNVYAANETAYIKADLDFGQETRHELMGSAATYDNDLGFGLIAGYQQSLTDHWTLGYEVEYRNIAEASMSVGGSEVSHFDANGVALNLAPKYYVGASPLYLGATLGLGRYRVNRDASVDGVGFKTTTTGWQLGFEAGYQVTESIGLSAGYRVMRMDIHDVDTTVSGAVVGMSYKF